MVYMHTFGVQSAYIRTAVHFCAFDVYAFVLPYFFLNSCLPLHLLHNNFILLFPYLYLTQVCVNKDFWLLLHLRVMKYAE